jgi:hypothetical protein
VNGAGKAAAALAIPAVLVCLVSCQLMCQDAAGPGENSRRGTAPRADAPPPAVVTTTAEATVPAGPTSVRVCIMMVIHKDYGALARIAGKKNVTERDEAFDAGKSWWDNPMVIYEDASFPNSAVTANADSAAIKGRGRSRNVAVEMTLVPHADVTLKSLVASDCIRGTLTATIATRSDYYDGKWTEVANVRDQEVAFDFDTSDKSRALTATTSESRSLPPFSFERYTRDRRKWEPRSAWPAKPRNGDWRCTIEVRDAKLRITGYQYAGAPEVMPN